jgi:hypothetical protein
MGSLDDWLTELTRLSSDPNCWGPDHWGISVYVFYHSQKNYCLMSCDFSVCLMLTIKYRLYLFWSELGSCRASCIAYEACLRWELRVPSSSTIQLNLISWTSLTLLTSSVWASLARIKNISQYMTELVSWNIGSFSLNISAHAKNLDGLYSVFYIVVTWI